MPELLCLGVTKPWPLTVNGGCISHMTTGKGTASLFAPFALCEHRRVPSEAFYQRGTDGSRLVQDDLSEDGVLCSLPHHPHWIIQRRSADSG